jgi:serine-type D-Ala-D-Ala carboxypeptidase
MQLRIGDPAEVGMCPERIERVRRRAHCWVDDKLHSALVVMAARRGVIVLQAAFGRLTPHPASPPVQLDSIFPLASLSKPIAATAVMILVDDALLGLHRRVQDYLPEFTGPGKEQVTVHHLLTHTAGIDDSAIDQHIVQKTGTTDLAQLVDDKATVHDLYVELSYDAPLICPPGQRHYYCQYGIELVGQIIERVSGQTLPDFAHERLFAPLGMNDTHYGVPAALRPRMVRRPDDAPYAQPETIALDGTPVLCKALGGFNTNTFMESVWTCGNVYSTAPDLLRFGQMFLNQGTYADVRILSPAAIALMRRNPIPDIGSWVGNQPETGEASYGYGWSITGNTHSINNGSLLSPEAVRHGGAGGVFIWLDPTYELASIYLSVELQPSPFKDHKSNSDLFVNGVTAAILS